MQNLRLWLATDKDGTHNVFFTPPVWCWDEWQYQRDWEDTAFVCVKTTDWIYPVIRELLGKVKWPKSGYCTEYVFRASCSEPEEKTRKGVDDDS